MKEIITSSGFKCSIDENRLDDMELFDAICEMEGGNLLVVPVIVSKILGNEKKALYDHLRQEDGRVPTTKVTEELADIMNALGKKQ